MLLDKLELGKSYQSKMLPRQNITYRQTWTRQKDTKAKCYLGKILLIDKLELGKKLPRQNAT